MTAALILKELRQHWLAFLLVALLAGGGLLVLAASAVVQGEAGSMLDALSLFLQTFIVIAALVLCNRLVVCEYQSKTQLFLQGLPISRLHMVTVKYVFGLLVLMAVVTGAFTFLLLLSARTEQLTGRFILILAARAFSYAWCVYSCFFMMGLLGRYRVAIYIFAILGAAAVETLTKLELAHFGPFALLNDQFAYERVDWPSQALSVTLGLAAALVAMTLVLSLVREGSVASLLAERMSHREKVLMATLLLGFVFAVSVFDERAKKQPFDLPDAFAARIGDVTVKVSLGASSDKEPGRRLARLVAKEAAALQEYLQIEELPPIFIVQRRDMDADRFRAWRTGRRRGAAGACELPQRRVARRPFPVVARARADRTGIRRTSVTRSEYVGSGRVRTLLDLSECRIKARRLRDVAAASSIRHGAGFFG